MNYKLIMHAPNFQNNLPILFSVLDNQYSKINKFNGQYVRIKLPKPYQHSLHTSITNRNSYSILLSTKNLNYKLTYNACSKFNQHAKQNKFNMV